MKLPLFSPAEDPGPDFTALLHGMGEIVGPSVADGSAAAKLGAVTVPSRETESAPLELGGAVRHGTTCVAVNWSGGVVMAGDRRATSGNFISHHRIEKVFPADSHSGVAVAGAAGPATEMVRLFQLQLEHYEKVEGTPLSIDGKANQLSHMVRSNLPAAIRGLAVLPIFAGFDLTVDAGRIFEYDITGGRYEERDYAATGSGSLHAETVLKLGFRMFRDRGDAVDLALEALIVAADSDAATGGPDLERGVFPIVAVIDVDGYRRIDDNDLSDRVGRLTSLRRSRRNGE